MRVVIVCGVLPEILAQASMILRAVVGVEEGAR